MADVKITVTEIGGGIWQFNEPNEMVGGPYVDAYLIIGSKRALLVDSLQYATGLYEKIRKLTNLPLDVVVTHGHLDHAGVSLTEFHEAGCGIYMDIRDLPILNSMIPKKLEADWFQPVPEGKVFDLGDFIFEVIAVPGHSPGSIVLLEQYKQLLFSGDSIGSGHFWMQLSDIPLNRFVSTLEKLYDKTKNLHNLLIYPGHRNQSPVQLTGQYVKDVLTVTRKLVSGVLEGEDGELNMFGREMKFKRISYGMVADYLYDPANLHFGRPDPENEAVKDLFTVEEMRDGGHRFGYMFYTPESREGETYPMVIYLHGAGERGDDTRLALANSGGTAFAHPDWQKEHPCFVFAPQCPADKFWTDEENIKLIVKAIQVLPTQYPIDTNRVYVTGLSMGGMGTWELISKYPQLVAAAMPICGAGNPMEVKNAKNVPVWAFHAADDPAVPAAHKMDHPYLNSLFGTATMVAALRSTANPNVRYTEYEPGYMEKLGLSAHASWIPAYSDKEALEWMFSQTRYDRYEVELIQPGVWFIDDFRDSSFYIVEGTEKALVIDTGMGGGDIIGLIKSLTKLPFELAITHAHGDHMMHSDKFGKFYMSKKEEAVLPRFMEMMMSDSKTTADDILDIKDGDIIDLGGGVVIEVLEINGHSPGSVAYLDRTHNLCFTGDAIGSGAGVWMQVPGALDLSEYKRNLEHLISRLSEEGLEDLWFLGGHRWQELGHPKGSAYNPLTKDLIRDMITLCGMVLNDDVDFGTSPISHTGEPTLMASHRSAMMLFRESNRK